MDKDNKEKIATEEVKDDYVMKLPDSEKEEKKIEPNRKASWWVRIVSGIIDFGLIALATMGFNQIFNNTVMGKTASNLRTEMILIEDHYKLTPLIEGSEETYGHKVYENEEQYQNYTSYVVHTDEEVKYVVVDNETISKELVKAFSNAVKTDTSYKNLSFDYRLVSYGICMLSCFIAETVVLLIVPLINKGRATPGKLLGGLMLINSRYESKAKWYQIVGRFSYQYIIETALLYLFLDYWILLVAPILIFTITLFNKKGRTIHDFISFTRVIDKRSYLPIDKQ